MQIQFYIIVNCIDFHNNQNKKVINFQQDEALSITFGDIQKN